MTQTNKIIKQKITEICEKNDAAEFLHRYMLYFRDHLKQVYSDTSPYDDAVEAIAELFNIEPNSYIKNDDFAKIDAVLNKDIKPDHLLYVMVLLAKDYGSIDVLFQLYSATEQAKISKIDEIRLERRNVLSTISRTEIELANARLAPKLKQNKRKLAESSRLGAEFFVGP